jgi:hypothetical protein
MQGAYLRCEACKCPLIYLGKDELEAPGDRIPPEIRRGIVETAEAMDDAIAQIDEVVFGGKDAPK